MRVSRAKKYNAHSVRKKSPKNTRFARQKRKEPRFVQKKEAKMIVKINDRETPPNRVFSVFEGPSYAVLALNVQTNLLCISG